MRIAYYDFVSLICWIQVFLICYSTNTDYCILARTGWKPKKNIAQSNALGTVDHLFCALKEQKEGGSVPTANNFVDVWVWILFSFCAYSAPVCLYIFTQSVALGYIPVGASPRPCSKHLLHTILGYTSCLGLRSAIVRKPNCYTILWRRYYLQSCLLHFNKYGLLHFSKNGLKAQKELSPEQRSGYSWTSILRSERAKGRRKCAVCKQFCWCMGMVSFFLLRLQRASLFIHPYPERCSGLYSCWGFAPSSLETSAAQYPVIYTCWGFAPQFYVSPIVIQYFDRDIFYNFRFIDSNNWICFLCYNPPVFMILTIYLTFHFQHW